MYIALSILTTLVFIALVAGLIKPKLVEQESKKVVLKIFGTWFLLLSFITSLFAPESVEPLVVDGIEGKAHKYQLIERDDTSFRGRDRLRWIIIAPTAITKADRAATAMKAARDLQNETNADLAQIWLEAGKFATGQGMQLAIATYIPDGCGNSGKDCDGKVWKVSASDAQLTDQQLMIWKAWEKHSGKFMEDGLVNEQKLITYLAGQLNLPEDQIDLPWIDREKVKG